MVVTNMKELCNYSIQQKKLRAAEHRRKHEHSGQCSGLTDSEYKKCTTRQKSTFAKSRKFTHNRLWNYTNNKIKTL
jgi:hypothetical protein